MEHECNCPCPHFYLHTGSIRIVEVTFNEQLLTQSVNRLNGEISQIIGNNPLVQLTYSERFQMYVYTYLGITGTLAWTVVSKTLIIRI